MSIAYIREQSVFGRPKWRVSCGSKLWSPSYPRIGLYKRLDFGTNWYLIVWCEACASEHRRRWHNLSNFSSFPIWNIFFKYIYISLSLNSFVKRFPYFLFFLFIFLYTHIYIPPLLKRIKIAFQCRCLPDRRGVQLWWRSPTSCIQVEIFEEKN